jgi:hypothetical protein
MGGGGGGGGGLTYLFDCVLCLPSGTDTAVLGSFGGGGIATLLDIFILLFVSNKFNPLHIIAID